MSFLRGGPHRFADGFRKREKLTYRSPFPHSMQVRFRWRRREGMRDYLIRELSCVVCGRWREVEVFGSLACSPQCAQSVPAYKRRLRV